MSQATVFRFCDKEAVDYIQRKDPNFSSIFQRKLPQSQRRTLHQLVQAILRENVVKVYWKNHGNELEAIIPVINDGEIVIPISKRYVLHHVDIREDILYFAGGIRKKVDHPVEFIKLLNIQQDLSRLSAELENSVVNYALALTGAELRKERCPSGDDTLSYLLEERKKNPHFSPLVFAEQWVIEGHTLHPCSKTRLGLSAEEVTDYSPEWEGNPNVIPVAVHKDFVSMKSLGEESMTDILLKEYPFVEKAFQDQLSDKGTENYELIPVHPWQLEHTITAHFKEEIAQGLIVPLEKASISAAALLSFRSLAPAGNKALHHFKTAVDIQMTSAKRTVSPASVWNGPVISSILKEIQGNDPSIGSTLQFIEERVGGHFQSQNRDNAPFLQKNLSALLRENPERFLDEDEIAVPAAFLISTSPITGKVFLIELIEKYSQTIFTKMEEAALRYIHTYANLLLPGLLTLMTKYGISLEAHLQNAVPVFRNGLPVRFLLRDNGGIRIKEERLKRTIGMHSIDNSTNLLTNHEKDLFTMFSHALLHNHFGEMIVLLSKELGIAEKKLWMPVKEVILRAIARLKEDKDCREAVEALEKEMFSPLAPLKALVKMRLTDQFTDNAYTLVPNPLADKKGGNHEYAY